LREQQGREGILGERTREREETKKLTALGEEGRASDEVGYSKPRKQRKRTLEYVPVNTNTNKSTLSKLNLIEAFSYLRQF